MLLNLITFSTCYFLLSSLLSQAFLPSLQRPPLKAKLRKACEEKDESEIFRLTEELRGINPTTDIIKDFKKLDGNWKLNFSTAPTGEVPDESATGIKTYQTIDTDDGIIYNVIDRGLPEKGLKIAVGAEPTRKDRVALDFQTIEALSDTFPKKIVLQFPPREFFRAVFKASKFLKREPFDEIEFKEIGHFDVVYLDDDLRIQRNSEGNLFVNSRI